MHAYRRFVQTEMDKRGWTAADLQRSSGLTKQNLSRLLRDEREQLQQRPDAATVTALANAFSVDEKLVLSHVAEAMGLPTSRVEVAAAADLSNEELLRILAERLSRGGTHEPAPDPAAASPAPDRDDLADPAQPHGATTRPDGAHLARRGAPAADFAYPEPRREDYDLAADDSGPSLLEADDARAARRGEESQDPEDWT